MEAKILAGRFAGLPFRGGGVSLQAADMAALLTAATGLVKVLVGVGAAVGLGFALFSAMAGVLKPSDKKKRGPSLSLGSAPTYFETGDRRFWGIILDDNLEFKCDCQVLQVPFDFIERFEAIYDTGWFRRTTAFGHRLEVDLVDGSRYNWVELITPLSWQLATIGGVQKLDFQPAHNAVSPLVLYEQALTTFSPTVEDVEMLREKLAFTLSMNKDKITQLIGPDVLQSFFNLQSIP